MITQSLRVAAFMLFVAVPSFGQIDSALGFFPLSIGDVWQYHYHYNSGYQSDTVSLYFVTSVSADTLMPNGRQYKVVNYSGPNTPYVAYLRVDSSNASVFRYDQSIPLTSEERLDSLAARPGDFLSHDGGASLYCTAFDTSIVLGTRTVAKGFQNWILPAFTYTLAYGFGLVQRIDPGEAPSWLYPIYSDIVYAKINGIEYGEVVSVKSQNQLQPPGFSLRPSFPNPFNGGTTINFSLYESSKVSLKIFNVLGESMATLLDADVAPGEHTIRWTPEGLPSGVYLCRLIGVRQVLNQKMLYVK